MNTMIGRFFLLALLLVMSIGVSSAVLTYDGSSHTYFINTNDPLINITVKSFNDPFTLEKAQIKTLSDSIYDYTIEETYSETSQLNERRFESVISDDIPFIPEANKLLNLHNFTNSQNEILTQNEPFSHGDTFEFYLEVRDQNDEIPETDGTPKQFEVKIDTMNPQFNYPNDANSYVVNENSPEVTFDFSEPLQYFKLENSQGEILVEERVESQDSQDFISQYEYLIEGDEEKRYNYTAELIDRAGNKVEEEVMVLYEGPPLKIKLHTKADDSSIPYYYNESHQDLFGRTIYSDTQEFELQIETSKESTCYFTDSLGAGASIQQKSVQGLLEDLGEGRYEELSSSNSLNHTQSLSIATDSRKAFWVGCENNFNSDDSVFLSQTLTQNKEMLLLEYYDEDFSISIDSPPELVGQNNVYFQLSSTQEAFCSAQYDDTSFRFNATNNFEKHTANENINNGEYSIEYLCYNLVYESQSKTKSLEVDENAGIDIIFESDNMYEGKFYSDTSQLDIEFSTSQIPQQCGFSTQQIEPTTQFNETQEISSTVSKTQFSFTTQNLDPSSKNNHYIYCKDELGVVTSEEIQIIYDNTGPVLNNLYYNNFGVKSQNYIGSSSKLNLEFDVDSVIPVERFNVTLLGENNSKDFSFSNSNTQENYTKELKISQSLDDYNSVAIVAETILSSQSSPLTGDFTLDISPPEVELIKLADGWSIGCSDSQSGCARSWLGTGKTEDSCSPNQVYSQNLTLNTSAYSYVCAKSQNNAGIESSITTKEIENTSISDLPQPSNNESLGTDINDSSSNNTTQDNETLQNEDPFEPDPFEPSNEDDSNTPYYILTAVLLLLATGGAGGWYAYRKGYLDKQLKKMGIPTSKNRSGGSSTTTTAPNKQAKNTQKRPNLVSKKSKYDKHLNKLNKFLDNAMNKKQDVYDSFEDGKSKMKGEEKKSSSKKSPKKFDEFYSASQGNNTMQSSLEKETEEFEQYHKEKKEKDKQETEKTKSKKGENNKKEK